jgi:hypothetical protein
MIMQTILTKALSDGREARVVIRPDWTIEALVGDESLGTGSNQLTRPVRAGNGRLITHAIGNLGLTADEDRQISDAWGAAYAARPRSLDEQRAELVEVLNGAAYAYKADKVAAQDRGDVAAAVMMDDCKVEAARAALARFDEAHPEIAAKIEADRDAAAQRHAMFD